MFEVRANLKLKRLKLEIYFRFFCISKIQLDSSGCFAGRGPLAQAHMVILFLNSFNNLY